MIEAIDEGHNQYIRTWGHPDLVKTVARIYGEKLQRKVDPMTEVIITMGALGGIMSFIMAFVNEGDEVCLFEPTYPLYLDHIRICGGKVKGVPLDFSEGTFRFDPEKLRQTLSEKTKLFIFNNPNNPAGKCFTREEIEQISKVLEEFPHILVLSDEVYEHLTFDDRQHVFFA
jgi:aspartate/methionine/tyrosine aminotransferase